jgi:hypothetical protein
MCENAAPSQKPVILRHPQEAEGSQPIPTTKLFATQAVYFAASTRINPIIPESSCSSR